MRRCLSHLISQAAPNGKPNFCIHSSFPTPNIEILTLQSTHAIHILNEQISSEMISVLRRAQESTTTDVVILTSEGKSFMVGADVKMMASWRSSSSSSFQESTLEPFRDLQETFLNFPKPLIAAVNGFALGCGCALATLCDIVMASEKAVFGFPEVRLGLIPFLGTTQRLPQLIGKTRAMEWILSGKYYSATEAEHAGLVSSVHPVGDLTTKAVELATTIASRPASAVRLAKEAMSYGHQERALHGLKFEQRCFTTALQSAESKKEMERLIQGLDSRNS